MYHSFSEGLRIASEGCTRHWSATLSFSKSSLHSSECLWQKLLPESNRQYHASSLHEQDIQSEPSQALG